MTRTTTHISTRAPKATSTMALAQPTRLHSLDALRGSALLLGVLFHAAFSFFPGDQFWLIMDESRSVWLSGLAFILHIFRMTIFFLLAGYFARLQTHRLGTKVFLRDRLKRIGLPLIIFWPIVMITFVALAISALIVTNGGVMPENPPPAPPLTLKTFPLTHLWFLYALIWLYAVSLLIHTVLVRLRLAEPLGLIFDRLISGLSAFGLLPLILAIPTAAMFITQTGWHPFFGIPTPEYGFVPNAISSVAYGTAFAIGWALQRDLTLLRTATRFWPAFLILAGVLSAYCLSQIGLTVSYTTQVSGEAKTYYAIAYSVAIWSWTFGLMGLCLRIWSSESRLRRYIADASYWIYLIHLPIVMALQVWMSQWEMAAEMKFILILGLSLPFMFLTYSLLVRHTFIGALLNGRKRPRVKPVKAEVLT